MAARVAQKVGSESDPHNFLLMHAMGPNVAGVIGSAVAARLLHVDFRWLIVKNSEEEMCTFFPR